MRTIIKYIMGALLFCSCAKEDIAILDLRATADDISRIELRADHKTLIPDGISKMEFYTFVYGKKTVISYNKTETGEYTNVPVEIEYLIPNDQLPKDYVKVYDSEGKELKDRIYSTTTESAGALLEFYAKAGTLESNKLPVTIRPLPDETYDEIIVPVIFHMLIPPATAGPTYDITTEYLENSVQRMNDIFNRRVTTDPNAGNLKVTFKLAAYDKGGVKLQERGKNIIKLTAANITAIENYSSDLSVGYNKFIVSNKSSYVWDPTKYLNIWLTKFSTGQSELGKYSYKYMAPTVIHSAYDIASIPGLSGVKMKDDFVLEDVADCLEVGIMLNYMAFLNPLTQGSNEFNLATVIGGYYGLLLTQCDKYTKLNPDGDSDYCPDTYSFDYGYYPTVFKGNNLDGQPENDPTRPMEYFTSFNIMDVYSRKNSISADQVVRMREVMEKCPSRWSYKSNWAFTGRK